MDQSENSNNLDGIIADSPSRVATTSAQSNSTISLIPERQKAARKLLISLIGFSLIYIVPGLFLSTLFPRTDGQLATIRSLATIVYGLGTVAVIGFFVFALSRIGQDKDHPRLRFFALIRLASFSIPILLCSGLFLFLINRAPQLSLEILSPVTQEEFVAPVVVSFGMQTALEYFRQQQLTPLSFQWDFNGDGISDQDGFESQATFIFGKANVYNVTATITMSNGVRKKVSRRLLIPRSSFSVTPAQPVIDEPVTFSLSNLYPAKGGDPKIPTVQKAQWDFDNDGTVDEEVTELSVSTTYHKLGSAVPSVRLTLSNQTQLTLKRTVTVSNPLPQPFPVQIETQPSTLLGAPQFGVLFSVKTKEPIANVTWDFGNKKTAEGIRVAQVFNEVGMYVVQATVRSSSGAVARLSKVVRVTNPLNISDLTFTGTPEVKSFSIEGDVPLTIDISPETSLPLISFSWDVDQASELSAVDKTLHAVFRDPGTYAAELIGIDTEQRIFRRKIKIIAKQPLSFVNFTMDPESPSAPALVKFDGSDTFVPDDEITGFEWEFGDRTGDDSGSKFSGARMEHLYEKPGTYTVTLKVLTTSGKSYDHQQTITVRAPIVDACFLPSRRTGKAPLGVRFDTECSTGEFATWKWQFGDGAESDQVSPTHVYSNPGEYTVRVTATRSDGLTSTKSTTISVLSPSSE